MDYIPENSATFMFILLWAIFALTWYVWLLFFKPRYKLPPGPPGLPLFGNLLSLDPELHSYLATLSQTYGPIFTLRLGTKYAFVFTSPSMAREVLKDQDITFANRVMPIAGLKGAYGGRDIVSNPYGPEWRMLRKVCVSKMLSNTTLDSVYTLRRREVRKTVGFLYSKVGSTVNIGEQIFLTVLNVITNMMWGETVEVGERTVVGADSFPATISNTCSVIGRG